MQPISEFKNQLFASHADRVKDFSFNHVVPKENVLPLVVSSGPSNIKFSFNFTNRLNKEMVRLTVDNSVISATPKFKRNIFSAQRSLINFTKCVQCRSRWCGVLF